MAGYINNTGKILAGATVAYLGAKAYEHHHRRGEEEPKAGGNSYLFGMVVAGITSYFINGSIGWAIFHSLLSWTYIIYKIIMHFI